MAMTSHMAEPQGLLLVDLLQDLATVVDLMTEQIRICSWLDAYLLCAAADQILEDALGGRPSLGHRGWWRRVARELERGRAARPAGALVRSGVGVADRFWQLTPRYRRVARAHQTMSCLADDLAALVLDSEYPAVGTHATLSNAAEAAAIKVRSLPGHIQRRTLRLPSCFRSFDQHPADIETLVSRFVAGWPDRSSPLTIVGVRTSGSYLAPLATAAARRAGDSRVDGLTIRPGVTPGPAERRLLTRAARRDHWVLILDDPPVSGQSVQAVAESLVARGIRRDRIVLLLAVQDGNGVLPDALSRYHGVTLPWSDWHVHTRLQPAHLQTALQRMQPEGVEITDVSPWYSMASPRRGHVRVFCTAKVAAPGTAPVERVDFAVEGAGLGFFGRHSVAIAHALDEGVPTVFGFEDGLVYRQWLPGPPSRLRASDPALVSAVADYAARRHATLPATHDRSRELDGEQPVWEVASMILSKSLGRAGIAFRPLVTDRLAHRLLAVQQPSVIDGRMGGRCWFRRPGSEPVKVDFASANFSNLDLSCYDPIFDLAGAAIELGDADQLTALRGAFERSSGMVVDDERWLLYQLVHGWNAQRTGHMTTSTAKLLSTRAVHQYLAAIFLSDLPVPADGPLCAIDIDGVLETESMGFSATSVSGALALRALRAHGYRAVLATGRSVDEVADRCRTFDLAGGVAEYGSAVFDARTGVVTDLLGHEGMAAVASLHEWLGQRADLDVDTGYRRIARVRLVDGRAGRSVASTHLEDLPQPAGGRWQLIVGEGQTDIVGPGIDKGLGLRALARRLQPGASDPILELAVGDTEYDLPMLRLARRPFAPANASPALQAHQIPVLRSGYQMGLAESVGHLIGHRPGACDLCAPRVYGTRAQAAAPGAVRARRGRRRHAPAPPITGRRGRQRRGYEDDLPVQRRAASPDTRLCFRPDGGPITSAVGVSSRPGRRSPRSSVSAYWTLAAHNYSPSDLGRNSAAISAMMFLAGVAELNLMSALVRFLPIAGRSTVSFVRTVYVITIGTAFVLAVAFLAVVGWVAPSLRMLVSSPPFAVGFVVATMVWTVFVLQDSVLTGLHRTWLVPVENGTYAIGKLILLLPLAVLLPRQGIFVSWTLALLLSVVPVTAFLFWRAIPTHQKNAVPDLPSPTASEIRRFAAADYGGALCWMAAINLLPVVVLDLAGAGSTGVFSVSWVIAYSLYLVSANMGTSLVVESVGVAGDVAKRFYQVVTQTTKLISPVVAVLVIGAPEILRLFGSVYSDKPRPCFAFWSSRLSPMSSRPAPSASCGRGTRRGWARRRWASSPPSSSC